ncbi:hypothetical protein HY635_01980 [Candidatus Uhrbacteria bacterium]|nr:hypothetical protein [Candidatus Uhrbacteria bacterium]
MAQKQDARDLPVCDRYFVEGSPRAWKSGDPPLAVDTYDPASGLDRAQYFAAWLTPRGWQLFLFNESVMEEDANRLARMLGGLYIEVTGGRKPDVFGSRRHSLVLGTLEVGVYHKTRGPYAPSARTVRHILRSILDD